MQKQNLIFATVAVLLMVFTGALFQVSDNKIHRLQNDNAHLRADVENLTEQIASTKRVLADQMIISTELLGEITPEEAVKMLKKND